MKMYDRCCDMLRRHPEHVISGKSGRSQRIHEPPMDLLFGKKELVSEIEMANMGEREKRRHLLEDHVLWSTYIKTYKNNKS